MKTARITTITALAEKRGAEYLSDYKRLATVRGQRFELSDEDHAVLREKCEGIG